MLRKDENTENNIPLLIVLAFIILFFFPVIIGHSVFFFRDFLYLDFPKAYYAVSMIHQGKIPWWDPFNGSGMPFFAILSNRMLYPPFWILFFCPLETLAVGFSHFLILHYLLAAAGMYFFLRMLNVHSLGSLVGSIIYSMNGYMILMTSNPLYLVSASWLPLSMICALKLHRAWGDNAADKIVKTYLLIAFVFVVQFFHGETQGFYLNAVVAAGYFLLLQVVSKNKALFTRPLFYCLSLMCIVIILMVIAVQAVPLWDYFKVTPRITGGKAVTLYDFSYHPYRLLTHIIPYFFGNMTAANPLWGNYLNPAKGKMLWSVTSYGGLLSVYLFFTALGLRTRKALAWTPMLLLALLASFGKDFYVYDFMHSTLPFFDRFRYPEKLLPYYYLPLAVIAAWGFDCLVSKNNKLQKERLITLSLLLLLISGVAILIFFRTAVQEKLALWIQQHVSLYEAAAAINYLKQEVLYSFIVLLVFIVCGMLLCFGPKKLGLACIAVIIIVNFTDVFYQNQKTNYKIASPHLFTHQNYKPQLATILQNKLTSPWKGRFLVDPAIGGASIAQSSKDYKFAHFMVYKHLLKPRINAIYRLNSFLDRDALNNARIQSLYYSHMEEEFKSILQLFNIRYFIGSAQKDVTHKAIKNVDEYVADGFLKKDRDLEVPKMSLYETSRTLPRFFLAYDWQSAGDKEQLFKLVFNKTDIFKRVTVEGFSYHENGLIKNQEIKVPAKSKPLEGITKNGITVTDCSENKLTLLIEHKAAALIVVNEFPAPGWHVKLDDNEVPLYHINYLMMGTYIPEGQHTVIFFYLPNYFKPSLILTALGICLWMTAFGITIWKLRKRKPLNSLMRVENKPK